FLSLISILRIIHDRIMLTGRFLSEARRKALRGGVWFKALDRVERGILSLAARVVDRVESAVLGVELVKILGKLRDALKGGFVRRMEEYGVYQAEKLAAQAIVWGYENAGSWASNFDFIRYLTLIDVNKPTGFGV
ncbi:MAG: hypothetical protein ACFFDT_13510, partial [Candidatus Hodarchaeota archaeon]